MGARELTATEAEAVAWFRKEHGRTWRADLRAAWMNACRDIPAPYQQPLQQLRNSGGPAWLASRSADAGVLAGLDAEAARLRIMEIVDDEMKKLPKGGRDALRATLVGTLDAERGD